MPPRRFRHTFTALSELSRLMAMSNTLVGTAGLRGFDCNTTVGRDDAGAFYEMGYRFAMRYVRRTHAASNDLSTEEIQDLHAAGLAVSPVQHYGPADGWVPTFELGHQYGTTAALACHELKAPSGITVWLDLEGIAPGTPAGVIIGFANAWHDAVTAAGLQSGLYVGWECGLTPTQLYHSLKTTRFWSSYNLNADQVPSRCGTCMSQHAALPKDKPAGVPYEIDVDTVTGDLLGRFPTFFGP